MLKPILILVLFIILGVGGVFLYQNLQTKPVSQPTLPPQTTQTSPTQITPPTSPQMTLTACQILEQGSADVPLLYKEGVTWEKSTMTEEKITEYDENYNQSVLFLRGCLVKATGVTSDQANEFDEQYHITFEQDKWKLVNDFAGPDGSLTTYKKQNKYLLIEKRINPKISSAGNLKYDLRIFYSQ
jgi:hypothetical protein